MKTKALIAFLFVGSLAMIIMSGHYLNSDLSGILKKKEAANSLWYLVTFRLHVFFGLVAIAAGPFQFIKSIRMKMIGLHKMLGYLYILSVLLSSMSGIIIAQFAMGGLITTIGFSVLAIAWFFCTLKAIVAICEHKLEEHIKWSFFSYALTFAAITQRTLLLVPLLTHTPFIPIYQLSAWLPWMINVWIASSLLRFSRAKSLST